MTVLATFKVSSLQQYMRLARLAADGGRGMTQEQATIRIPVSDRTLKRYEAGVTIPSEDVIERMATVYRIPALLDYYFEAYRREDMAA